ncbi:MAG: glycosyltransferase family 2 protein [Planctomycetales bacterium]|nr:glycosyltransferase family 2 protein [Planctomycetales bacterium]
MHPDISIVVCTFNRADMLRDALMSLTRLESKGAFSFEILVVDNASTDHTPQVAAEVAAGSSIAVRYVREERQGVACARNRGLAEATGQWIAFFDDDQLAEPDWLAELFAIAQQQNSRCVGGSVRLKLPADCTREIAAYCRPLLGESPQLGNPMRYGRKMAPGTGNVMIHRSVFDEVGRFDEQIVVRGEDSDLFERIDAADIEAWYTPRAVVWHMIPPERLADEYLLRLAHLSGWGPAKQDLVRRGKLALSVLWAARLARAALMFAPNWFVKRLSGDREQALAARCRLANTAGYSRSVLALLGPRRFRIQGYGA